MLQQDGILANQSLLLVHVSAFWVVTLMQLASSALSTVLAEQIHDKDYSHASLALSQQILDLCIISVWFVIMLTMFVMFVKYGTPLSQRERSAMTMRFLETFNKKQLEKGRNHQSHLTTSSSIAIAASAHGGGHSSQELKAQRWQ